MKSYLLCGFPQSGNLFTRMFIANYYYILHHDITETITFETLKNDNIYHFQNPEDYIKKEYIDCPPVYWAHCDWHEVFNEFDGVIYTIRNPHDNMLAWWYFRGERPNSPKQSLESIVKEYLPMWKRVNKSYMDNFDDDKDILVDYDNIPLGIEKALRKIYGDISFDVYKKVIEFSSIYNLKNMADKYNQRTGRIIGSFTGDIFKYIGTGVYKGRMSEELIEYIDKEVRK